MGESYTRSMPDAECVLNISVTVSFLLREEHLETLLGAVKTLLPDNQTFLQEQHNQRLYFGF